MSVSSFTPEAMDVMICVSRVATCLTLYWRPGIALASIGTLSTRKSAIWYIMKQLRTGVIINRMIRRSSKHGKSIHMLCSKSHSTASSLMTNASF